MLNLGATAPSSRAGNDQRISQESPIVRGAIAPSSPTDRQPPDHQSFVLVDQCLRMLPWPIRCIRSRVLAPLAAARLILHAVEATSTAGL